MTYAGVTDSALLEASGWALVHFVWQGALVAGLYACLDALASRGAAADDSARAKSPRGELSVSPAVKTGSRSISASAESASV